MLSIVSLLSPFCGFIVVLLITIKNYNKYDHKNLKRYVFPLGIFFGTFGYCMTYFLKDTKDDLQRYFEEIIKDKYSDLISLLKNDIDMLYLKDLLFHFINKIADVHILPFIVGFIIYSITFYIIFDLIEKSSASFSTGRIIIISIISIGMVSPYSIIGNTRCVLSYILVSFAIYRELVQKKIDVITLMLYILPIGLHTSTIIILAIRLISSLLNRFKKTSIIISILLPQIINIAYSLVQNIKFGFIGSIIYKAVDRAYFYLYWTDGGWASQVQNSIGNIVTRISGTVFLILCIITINKINKYEYENKMKSKIIGYIYTLLLFSLGCLTIKTGVFWRFEATVTLLSPIIIIYAFESKDSFKNLYRLFAILSIGMFIINIIYQARNIDLLTTIFNMILFSPVTIIYKVLKMFLL